MDDCQNLVTIHQYRDLPEALLAKGYLESAGIECFLNDENLVRLDWFWSNLVGGIRLLVKTDDVDVAIEVLEQPTPEQYDVAGVGMYERPRCPKCDSSNIGLNELDKPVAYISAYVGIPIPLHHAGWKCHECKHQWKDEPAQED